MSEQKTASQERFIKQTPPGQIIGSIEESPIFRPPLFEDPLTPVPGRMDPLRFPESGLETPSPLVPFRGAEEQRRLSLSPSEVSELLESELELSPSEESDVPPSEFLERVAPFGQRILPRRESVTMKNISDIVNRTQQHLRAVASIPFETREFNVEALRQVFVNNISRDGLIGSPDEFARELSDFVATGFAQALEEDDEFVIDRAINTITQAVTIFTRDTDDPANVQGLTNALIDEFLRAVPKESHTPALDISLLADEVFDIEVGTLGSRVLNQDGITRVVQQLGKDLLQNPRTLEELEGLIEYIDNTAQNEDLKKILVSIVRGTILRRQLLEQQRIPPPVVIPVSATKALVLQRSILDQFGAVINRKADQLQTRLNTRNPDKKAILREVRDEVARLNVFFKRAKIRESGSKKILAIKVPRQTAEEAIEFLRSVAKDELTNPKLAFTYIPPVSRGKAQDAIALVTELKQILNRGPTGIHRPMLPHPDRISQFGSITVSRQGDRREIVLTPGTPMSDIMKLAQALVMEPGTLEDISGREQLIITTTTKAGEVVSFIQQIFDSSMGQIARFLYIPEGLGEHVGGFLEGIIMGGGLMPIGTSLDSERMMRDKANILTSTIGEYSRYGVKPTGNARGGALPAIAAGAAVLSRPIANIADAIGKAVPPLKFITAPVKAVANVISSIGKFFGF